MDKYDAFFGSCAALVVIVLIGSATFSCADDRRQIVRAIEAGADPVMARCAVKGYGEGCGLYGIAVRDRK